MKTEKVQKIVDAIKELSLLEAFELKKALEEEFGVTASAGFSPMQFNSASASEATSPDEQKDAKTEFDVMLTAVPGDKKIGVIKVVKSITGLGLKEAKDLVEAAPTKIKEGVKKEEAENIKKMIEAEGGSVDIK
ncbi:50S ribosomal protein L7/L12 [Candidatus Dojkabacteria bacterium]|uniref:Large ribosomal subunit protein bL12 n=1 Tax=Candidatus Dojkabacteria bacterium TaxID=2099670 RepID=A0A3M0YZZ2_9BACT|nr:MAG: 50S ribosomal protein L7/L12 [Candidatus Dojkabacteria bacterium]